MPRLRAIIENWRRAREYNARPLADQVLQRTVGTAPRTTAGLCCIFAHYDPQGVVDPYVVEYLRRLRELDADIIFITTSDSLAEKEIGKIAPLCREIIRRANVSADFGSWNLGIHLLGGSLSAYRRLILTNDSVYGPFRPLAPIFEEMEARRLDFWGLTESNEHRNHLQSYFLVFEKSGLDSAFFRRFWGGFRQQWRKLRLIAKYEIGLSRQARLNSMRFAPWLSSARVGSGRKNPTLFFWEKLIEDFGHPFLKTEILKINRFRSANAPRWRDILKGAGDYDAELIANHLRRVGSVVEPA